MRDLFPKLDKCLRSSFTPSPRHLCGRLKSSAAQVGFCILISKLIMSRALLLAPCTFLSTFGSMSWKEWAKSEKWIQEQIKWKSTEKSLSSPCSPNTGSGKILCETLLIPLKFDLGEGIDSENIEQWYFQKEWFWFLVLATILSTF